DAGLGSLGVLAMLALGVDQRQGAFERAGDAVDRAGESAVLRPHAGDADEQHVVALLGLARDRLRGRRVGDAHRDVDALGFLVLRLLLLGVLGRRLDGVRAGVLAFLRDDGVGLVLAFCLGGLGSLGAQRQHRDRNA